MFSFPAGPCQVTPSARRTVHSREFLLVVVIYPLKNKHSLPRGSASKARFFVGTTAEMCSRKPNSVQDERVAAQMKYCSKPMLGLGGRARSRLSGWSMTLWADVLLTYYIEFVWRL